MMNGDRSLHSVKTEPLVTDPSHPLRNHENQTVIVPNASVLQLCT